jgi:hypothetical protein
MKIVASLGAAVVLITGVAVGAPSATPSGSTPPPRPGPSGSAHAHDAGPPETKEQRAYRMKYVTDTLKHEHEITQHHYWLPEMVKVANEHWRRAYRTLRIRELAEDDHDAATMSRAENYLKKIDTHFFALLTELTAKAPEIPGPPTLVSPADKSTVGVGTAATFKMAPYKDAGQYYCALYQPHHYWSNWQPGKDAKWGVSNDCTIAADDPKWSKFNSGKAHFVGRAIVKGKSPSGKEYQMWSQPVMIEVALTGGAPAPSGSGAPPPPPHPSSSASGGSK